MKRSFVLALPLSIVFASAAPAQAAWIPSLPGWTAQETPLALGTVDADPSSEGIALDPVSGDFFVVATSTSASVFFSLQRVSPSGQAQAIVDPAPSVRPVFDPIHRILYVPTTYPFPVSGVLRYDEHGAQLPTILDPAPGPIAVAPDGTLWSLAWHAPTNNHLELMRYDGELVGWTPVKILPLATGPGLFDMPDQMLFDASGKVFLVRGSAAYRVDDTRIVFLGGPLLAGPASIGAGFLFVGASYADPWASGEEAWSTFAASSPEPAQCTGSAVTPDGRVLFVSQNESTGPCSLVTFTLGATPTVRRSWGALKTASR